MFNNYFKIAFRNLWRNKALSFINIFGLALGIATCLIIVLYIQHELSYDRFHEKADQIVRVTFKGTVQGQKMNEANVMPPTAQTLKADYPEVLAATRLHSVGSPKIQYGVQIFAESKFAFVDSNFFSVFTFPFLSGNPNSALLQPNTLVISKTIANKYFGKEDPIGKILDFKDQHAQFTITGVMQDMPENSHFHFDLLGSMVTDPESREQSWMTSNYYTYLVLPKHFDYKKLEAKLPQVIEKYVGPQLEKGMGVSLAEFRKKGNDIGLYLQPLTSIHLHSNATVELSPPGDIQYVYIFGAVAVFMLLIACINFMNLSTAGASKRAREVGIRKVLGSVKSELIRQFMTESIVMTAFALVLSILIVYLAMPLFNQLAGQQLQLRLFEQPATLITLISLGLLTGIIAGSYPAFYLSSFNPITVLKGKFSSGKGSAGLRSGLVVFQFFISILLIVGTVVVYSQLSFIQHKKLGYDKDQVMIVESWHLGKNENAFTQQLLKDPRIVNISNSGYVPAGYSFDNNFFVYPGSSSNQMVKALRYDVDYNYIPTLGISVKEGRNFSKDFGSDSSGAILNESAAAALGWKNNALGQIITRPDNDGSKATYTVVGVVKDFHFKSLHELISPLIMVLSKQSSGNMIVKIKTKDIPGLVKTMQKDWASFGPDAPLSYSFLDERFNNTYRAEQKVGLILGIFAGLTIFVACLGLFGLARFTAEQRTKEIGIRKVLGASVSGIVQLLSKEFLKLVLIAFVVASPIAWYVMHLWLQDFAYRINIGWWVFALAALLAVIISLATISLQAVKAAIANPVKSLHAE